MKEPEELAAEELVALLDEQGIEHETYTENNGFRHVVWKPNEFSHWDWNLEFGSGWLSGWQQGVTPEQAVALTMGALTCHMRLREDIRAGAYEDVYECDACGEQITRGTYMGRSEPPRFCCGCGRKVTEG